MRKGSLVVSIVFLSIFFLVSSPGNAAESDDDVILDLIPTILSHIRKSSDSLQVHLQGATQLYTLDQTVIPATTTRSSNVPLRYTVTSEQQRTRTSSTGTGSNLFQVSSDGTTQIALSAPDGNVKALFTVLGPQGEYLYIALDYTDTETLSIIQTIGSGLIKANISTDDWTAVAPGYVVATLPDDYYTKVQGGKKPVQFDQAGNIFFNGYAVQDGVVDNATSGGVYRIANETVTKLTDDAQTIDFFLVMPSGEIVYQASNSLDSTKLWLWKESVNNIDLTNEAVDSLDQDDSSTIFFKAGEQLIFLRSLDEGGVIRAGFPNTTPWISRGDDGKLYGVQSSGTHLNVYEVLPYSSTVLHDVDAGSQSSFSFNDTPVQMSKGYLYYVAQIDGNDGLGTRDVINVMGLTNGNTVTLLAERRYEIYAWKQDGGGDKLYFTARDKAASSATMVSGVIDTLQLKAGRPESEFLTLTPVASATEEAANVKDIEILSPQVPAADTGYDPLVMQYYVESPYSQGIYFSKYMDQSSVESLLSLTDASNNDVPYIPVWFLQTIHLVPNTGEGGILGSDYSPLSNDVGYTVSTSSNIQDKWHWYLASGTLGYDKHFEFSSGTTCSYAVSPASLFFGASGGSETLTVATTTGCSWDASVNEDWLSITGTNGNQSGSVTIQATQNTSTEPRNAIAAVAGKTINISQNGAEESTCSYEVSPLKVTFPGIGGTKQFTISTQSECSWTVTSALSWLSVSASAGQGSATLSITASTNETDQDRSGSITAAGKSVEVSQETKQEASGVLPDTGVTKCYNGDSQISCPSQGEAFYGQDAQYNPVAQQQSFTDNGDGTVTDNITGLVWAQDDDGEGHTWYEAVEYCDALTLGGFSDWRLPTTNEFINLADFSRYSPPVPPYFYFTTGWYWTSNSVASDDSLAWKIGFNATLDQHHTSKTSYYRIRCVR
ncbi:DUF1566 domain-containing protein [Desulfovibrio inopinatus]|uniref:Lcl domain-containing protein n=1 Tax=Desulfovibrio inopinatus TaxID=102109 RepID=UPI0003F9CA3D|nr:DUF1566 domain-containing protein [Desulfovibrio inopinatus]